MNKSKNINYELAIVEGWRRREESSIMKGVAKRSIPLEYRVTQKSLPYFERTEELRKVVAEVLKETDGMTIHELHKKLRSFNIPTNTCLTAVLCKDPRKRFKSENKIWHTL